MQKRLWMYLIEAALVVVCSVICASAQTDKITVTLLGTGTPDPRADRFGAAVLVSAGGEHLLFDCGRGVVIRLKQTGVALDDVDGVFLTHLHSDHVIGIPDLWLTGWLLGRKQPLRIWGPSGTRALADHLFEAFSYDREVREIGPGGLPATGARLDAQNIEEGVVYRHGSLVVSSFLVDHGRVKPALGYRVDFADHSVVISGDTKLSQNLIDHAKGADCVIHAAWMASAKNPTPVELREIASGEDAGRVFSAVKPKLAVVYHYQDPAGLAEAVRSQYHGPLVIARDLMRIEIGRSVRWTQGT
jgi:ribonuclease Z